MEMKKIVEVNKMNYVYTYIYKKLFGIWTVD